MPDIENLYLANSSASTTYRNIITGTTLSPKSYRKVQPCWPTSVSSIAGCGILDRNEKFWEELHSANEENARKAEEIDVIIETITDSVNKRLVDLSDVNISLEAIPNLVKTVQNCSNVMHDVNKKCAEVEKQLAEFENLIEALQLQEKQLDHKFEMALYKERKLGEFVEGNIRRWDDFILAFDSTGNLENVRQDLAEKHASNVRKTETQLRVIQQERQAAFQDAFQSDMNIYKELGTIPSESLMSRSRLEPANRNDGVSEIEKKSKEPTLTLEEITLEAETNELNEFLNESKWCCDVLTVRKGRPPHTHKDDFWYKFTEFPMQFSRLVPIHWNFLNIFIAFILLEMKLENLYLLYFAKYIEIKNIFIVCK